MDIFKNDIAGGICVPLSRKNDIMAIIIEKSYISMCYITLHW